MDVRDGAILAAASAPAFDPNLFARGNSDELGGLAGRPVAAAVRPRLPHGDSARLDVQDAHGRGPVGVGDRRARKRRSPAKAICTSPTGSDAKSTSAKASATAR